MTRPRRQARSPVPLPLNSKSSERVFFQCNARLPTALAQPEAMVGNFGTFPESA
jgi:hypothetical protein